MNYGKPLSLPDISVLLLVSNISFTKAKKKKILKSQIPCHQSLMRVPLN